MRKWLPRLVWMVVGLVLGVFLTLYVNSEVIVDYVTPLHISVKVVNLESGTPLQNADVQFVNLDNGAMQKIGMTDSEGRADVSFGFWWGAGIPVWRFDLGYDDVDISLRLDITKDGFNTFEHPFQLKQLPAEGDGVWLNLDDIALQPLATSTADSLP